MNKSNNHMIFNDFLVKLANPMRDFKSPMSTNSITRAAGCMGLRGLITTLLDPKGLQKGLQL